MLDAQPAAPMRRCHIADVGDPGVGSPAFQIDVWRRHAPAGGCQLRPAPRRMMGAGWSGWITASGGRFPAVSINVSSGSSTGLNSWRIASWLLVCEYKLQMWTVPLLSGLQKTLDQIVCYQMSGLFVRG